MEDKRKRFRPTVTAYRALENLVLSLREKLRLEKREGVLLQDDISGLKSKIHVLEQSNSLMEAELKRLREANTELSKINKQLSQEAKRKDSRGFWDRLFNR